MSIASQASHQCTSYGSYLGNSDRKANIKKKKTTTSVDMEVRKFFSLSGSANGVAFTEMGMEALQKQ